jgi:hypothetical protein
MKPGLARIANIESDGWTLENAEERYVRGDDLFWLPSRSERDQLEEDLEDRVYAKLIFKIRHPTAEDPNEMRGERMWVKVASRVDDFYLGHLANEPHTPGGSVYEGMPVWFLAEHVIDIMRGEGEPASRSAKTIECCTHGLSEACFVCEHLVGATGVGFHAVEKPERLRPDAWCDKCEELLQEVDYYWNRLGDRHPKISLLCGGCYDRTRESNKT